jgi:hypothetical protein
VITRGEITRIRSKSEQEYCIAQQAILHPGKAIMAEALQLFGSEVGGTHPQVEYRNATLPIS